MIPDSLRNLYDPAAGYFEPKVGHPSMYSGSIGDEVYREISQGAASDFWRKKYDEVNRKSIALSEPFSPPAARVWETCSDSDAIWKWKFYRQSFIDYGKQDDFDMLLKFVREGETGYDDIALADWQPESGHQPSWWLAAWWHRRCARARDFWKDHFGSARLRQPSEPRGRPLGLLGNRDTPQEHKRRRRRAKGRRGSLCPDCGSPESRCISCGCGLR